jgi:hypothetical protein
VIAVHTTAPSFVQRAVVVALLSFSFFAAMLIVFLVRQQFGYLVLAAAFLALNLFVLIGIALQRSNVVYIFEKGIRHKRSTAAWSEIVSIDDEDGGLKIVKNDKSVIKIPRSIAELGRLNTLLREKTRH